MSYKTILVHLNDTRRAARIADAAAELAERFHAHLIGLSVAPPVHVVPTGMPASPDTLVIDERGQAYRAANPVLRAAFEAAAKGRGLASKWREEEPGSATVANVLARYGGGADLIVAAQSDPNWAQSALLDVADHLAVETGRPVLIVPNQGLHSGIGTRVLIAWNGWREAIRATYDSLPFLERAENATILCLHPESEADAGCALAAAALARHGVPCQVLEVPSNGNVGRTLINRAIELRADLIVMGCYGHSRLRELVLGGATRHILMHTTIPVLMSH